MKLVLLLCFLTAVLATHDDWMNFKLQHGKSYEDLSEEYLRLQIYEKNKLKIYEHNRRYELGLETYTLEMNKFGDLTEEEFAAAYLNEDLTTLITTAENGTTYTPRASSPLPLSVDWRNRGAVTNVKNQGNCGACYAFSAVGALETQIFLKTGQLTSLSAQQIVDCSLNYRYKNKGCKGGHPENSYRYIKDVGIAAEHDYPYEGNIDWRIGCRYGRGMRSAGRCTGFVHLRGGDEAQLADAVANVGTIAVLVQSSKSNFQFYKSGVHFSPRCDHKYVDHAMVLVGYGTTDTGEDYWIVKNSWGPEWGEGGYIRMARNRGNNCGIASGSSYPLV